MLPAGINPKDMEKLLKRMGMNIENIGDAREVIIKCDNKEIIIKEPVVQVVRIQGIQTFQIQGRAEEKPLTTISDEDIELVAQQANVSMEEARKMLEECNGDIAEAIMRLKGE